MLNLKKIGLWAVQWAIVGALFAVLGGCGAQPEPPARLPTPAPVVNQTATFTASATGLTVTFDASAFSGTLSGTQTTAPASFQWNFGDGTPVQTTTSVTITHVYAASGTYVVNLVLLDAQGVAGKVLSQNVTVAPLPVNPIPPIAQFVVATNGLGVGVDASLSTDPDGTITTYAWNFGEPSSSTNTASGKAASHTYGATGTYTVTLVVTDNTGRTATSQQQANIAGVLNVNPIANFSTGVNALLVNFSAAASTDPDGTITTYSWNFGEPNSPTNTAAGVIVSHGFKFAGNYTVTLTVTDDKGSTGNRQTVVTVITPVAIATGVLNDTGITASQCYQAGSDALISCTSTAAVGLNNAQDGMVGRDASPGLNTVVDGELGFSFTKIGANGETLPASAKQWHCVKDNTTGLIWENKTNDGGRHDAGLRFTNLDNTAALQLSNGTAPSLAQINAQTNSIGFVNLVNAEGLCGATDWRRPEIGELLSIVDYGITQTDQLDASWFSEGSTVAAVYLSAADSAGIPADRQMVVVSGQVAESSDRVTGRAIRLVRGSPGNAPTSPRFEVLVAEQVTDNSTGLTWRICPEGMSFNVNNCIGTPTIFTHAGALTHASVVGNGWRVPNIKELNTLVDRSFLGSLAAIDNVAFPSTPGASFWASTPQGASGIPTGLAWYVNFSNGRVESAARTPFNLGSTRLRLVKDTPIP
jgi:PKD repeat protein